MLNHLIINCHNEQNVSCVTQCTLYYTCQRISSINRYKVLVQKIRYTSYTLTCRCATSSIVFLHLIPFYLSRILAGCMIYPWSISEYVPILKECRTHFCPQWQREPCNTNTMQCSVNICPIKAADAWEVAEHQTLNGGLLFHVEPQLLCLIPMGNTSKPPQVPQSQKCRISSPSFYNPTLKQH